LSRYLAVLYSSRSQSPASLLLCVHFPFPLLLTQLVDPLPQCCHLPFALLHHIHAMFLCWSRSVGVYRVPRLHCTEIAFFFVRLRVRVRIRICIIRRQTSPVGVYPFSRLLTWPLYSVPAVARASPACKWSVCLRVADCCCRIGRCFRAARSCPSSCLNAGRRVFRETRVDPRRPTRPTCRQFCTRSAVPT